MSTAVGRIYDGTVTMTEGSADYSLTIGGVTMSGSILLAWSKNCVTETFSGLSVSSTSTEGTSSGELTYCDDGTRPSGTTDFQTDGTLGPWSFDMTLDGADTATATVFNIGTGITESCTIDLATRQVTCG
jgi:hypothetical protein